MTQSSNDRELLGLVGRLIDLVEEQNRILQDQNDYVVKHTEYLHTVDWKLWETYKILHSKALKENLEIVEPFNVDKVIE